MPPGRAGAGRMDAAAGGWIAAMAELAPAIDQFIASLRREAASDHTVRNYGVDLRQFVDYCTPPGASAPALETVDLRLLREFVGHLFHDENQSATIRRKIASLRGFFRFCLQSGWIDRNPAKLLLLPKLGQSGPKVPTSEQ